LVVNIEPEAPSSAVSSPEFAMRLRFSLWAVFATLAVPALVRAEQPPEAVLNESLALRSPYGQFVSQQMSFRDFLRGTRQSDIWRQPDETTFVKVITVVDPVTQVKSELLLVFENLTLGQNPFMCLTRLLTDGRDASVAEVYAFGSRVAVVARSVPH